MQLITVNHAVNLLKFLQILIENQLVKTRL
jgi:hypothetical protein